MRSQGPVIKGDGPPADEIKAATTASHRVLGNLHGTGTLTGMTRQKEDANRNPPLRIEIGIQARSFAHKKGGRELGHDAGTITAGAVGVHTTAVREILQAHQRLLHHAIRGRFA